MQYPLHRINDAATHPLVVSERSGPNDYLQGREGSRIRAQAVAWLAATTWLIITIMSAAAGVNRLSHGHSDAIPELLLALTIGLVAARTFASSVQFQSDRVVIKGVVRTESHLWADLTGVEETRDCPWWLKILRLRMGHKTERVRCRIQLKDGRQIAPLALQTFAVPSLPEATRRVHEAVEIIRTVVS